MSKEKAFIKLIREHQGLIYKVTRFYLDKTADQNDLYQEIVYQLWKSFDTFRGESKISTWMYRIALNTALLHLKREKRKGISVGLDEINLSSDTYDSTLDELALRLHEQIKDLNEIDKGIIFLYLEGKRYSEIGTVLGLSENNVGTRMARIKQTIKNRINT